MKEILEVIYVSTPFFGPTSYFIDRAGVYITINNTELIKIIQPQIAIALFMQMI